MGTGQYRSFHTSARGFLCLFITDKIGQHILCGMPYACWDNKPWNTAVPFSPFRQIRCSSHLSFWKKPIGICRQNLQISGHKKPANSWYTKAFSLWHLYCLRVLVRVFITTLPQTHMKSRLFGNRQTHFTNLHIMIKALVWKPALFSCPYIAVCFAAGG